MEIVKRQHWDKLYKLPANSLVIHEVFFWKDNVAVLNKRSLFSYSKPEVILYWDASHYLFISGWDLLLDYLLFVTEHNVKRIQDKEWKEKDKSIVEDDQPKPGKELVAEFGNLTVIGQNHVSTQKLY